MSMFRVKEIEAVLRNAVTDNMSNIFLIHENGGVIAAAHPKEVDHSAVALLASAAHEFKCAEVYVAPELKPEFEGSVFFCENALVACRAFLTGKQEAQMLLCVWCNSTSAATAQPGVLLSRLELLRKELECLQPLLSHCSSQQY
mmetsp:Transcript_17638/g.20400  ORF Transcript_17638/g.20400 Transcript_17638/m.20400 type:complete len:144 (+) Transcript_17638:51-482(+)